MNGSDMNAASYLSAWLEVFTLCNDALVVIDVVLPAMFGLVHVWEASVKPYVQWHPCQLLIVILSSWCAGQLSVMQAGGGVPYQLRIHVSEFSASA